MPEKGINFLPNLFIGESLGKKCESYNESRIALPIHEMKSQGVTFRLLISVRLTFCECFRNP